MTPDFLWVGMAGLVFIVVIIAVLTVNKRGENLEDAERKMSSRASNARSKSARLTGMNR